MSDTFRNDTASCDREHDYRAPHHNVGETWDTFVAAVAALLEPTAVSKGYTTQGIDGRNELYEFVQGFAGFGHAGGEIVYKVKRYAARRNPEDLLKVAAWAFLAWKHHKAAE